METRERQSSVALAVEGIAWDRWPSFLRELERLREDVLVGDLKQRLTPKAHGEEMASAARVINHAMQTDAHVSELHEILEQMQTFVAMFTI